LLNRAVRHVLPKLAQGFWWLVGYNKLDFDALQTGPTCCIIHGLDVYTRLEAVELFVARVDWDHVSIVAIRGHFK
jgi:hypothetical protein